MTNAPHPVSPFESLVEPLSASDFLSILRARKLTLLRSTQRDRFAHDLTWDALKRMLGRGQFPRGKDHMRVIRESVLVPPEQWSKNGKPDPGKLEVLLAKGFNVILTHIEPLVPSLDAICRDIRSRFSEYSYAGVIVTKGTDGAFRRHFDLEDLIIIQVEGSKRWQLFGPPVANPVRGISQGTPPDTAPVFDEVLENGDFMFLPAGNWHHCENGAGTSVHLGIFFGPPTAWHAARRLTTQLLADELFRIPLTRFTDEAEFADLESRVKERFQRIVAEMDLREFLRGWEKPEN
jgi:cupin superfamily protein